jgi:surface antigen
MGEFWKYVCAASSACILGGCGVVPDLVGSTAQAALSPFSTLASQATYGLQVATPLVQSASSVATSTATTAASTVNSSVQTAAYYVPLPSGGYSTSSYSAPSYSSPSSSSSSSASTSSSSSSSSSTGLTNDQIAAIQKAQKSPQQDLPVLPKETMKALTEDQRGLQIAAQHAALKDPVGETLSWDDEGRSGTAVAEDERHLGDSMLCRSWVETVTIDGKKTTGHATACRDGEKGHWVLAF